VSALIHASASPHTVNLNVQGVGKASLSHRTFSTHLLDGLAGVHAIFREEQFGVYSYA
jgi:hypothetical protein